MVPFGGEGYGEIIDQARHRAAARGAQHRAGASPTRWTRSQFRALAKDPATRFQTMAEFREALLSTESALSPPPAALVISQTGGLGAIAQPESGASSVHHLGEVGGAPQPWRRARPAWSFLLGGAAAVAVSLALFVVASSGARGQATSLGTHRRAPATRHGSGELWLRSTGAIVSRSDGAVLGVTPCRPRFRTATSRSSIGCTRRGTNRRCPPSFPTSRRRCSCFSSGVSGRRPASVAEAPVSVPPGGSSVGRPVADVPSPARARAPRESRHRMSAERLRDLVDDGDDVMPPSTQ